VPAVKYSPGSSRVADQALVGGVGQRGASVPATVSSRRDGGGTEAERLIDLRRTRCRPVRCPVVAAAARLAEISDQCVRPARGGGPRGRSGHGQRGGEPDRNGLSAGKPDPAQDAQLVGRGGVITGQRPARSGYQRSVTANSGVGEHLAAGCRRQLPLESGRRRRTQSWASCGRWNRRVGATRRIESEPHVPPACPGREQARHRAGTPYASRRNR